MSEPVICQPVFEKSGRATIIIATAQRNDEENMVDAPKPLLHRHRHEFES